jgi:hypothetical protein
MGEEYPWWEAKSMIRVIIICEGQTEETFVRELLVDAFLPRKIYLIPRLIGKPGHKGGNVNFDWLFIDVRNTLKEDKSVYCTTFIDYYALPSNFPGKQESEKIANITQKHEAINNALNSAVEGKLGSITRRFIPYVQMYEFEALLFSDPTAFAKGIFKQNLRKKFKQICDSFESPEMINDSPNTAPSKRVVELIPDYDKTLMGSLAALEIGLPKIREVCQIFDSWLKQLENLQTEKKVSV